MRVGVDFLKCASWPRGSYLAAWSTTRGEELRDPLNRLPEAEALGVLFFDNLATLLSVSSYVDSSLAQWQNRSNFTHTATP